MNIGQWQRFEATLKNTNAYTNPYADVSLDVTYQRPDGSAVSFWGFYDGGSDWKIRFMPDQLGTWHYEARFSDGTPGTQGSFTCVESDLPGMLTVDESNPLWFGYKGGGHVLVRSFHVGDGFFASNMPSDRRAAFLDWAQAQGYNMLSIGSHYLNRSGPGRGQGWDTPKLWPLNAAEYRRMESILDDLTARRFLIFPFGGFFGRGAGYPTEPLEQELYVRYTLARLGANWNILLNVSGPEPLLDKEAAPLVMPKMELDRLGRLIQSLNVFGHPLTVHNKTGDDEFRDDDYIDYGTLQGPKTTDPAVLSEGLLRNHHPSRPLYVQETLWSGNKFHPDYSDEHLRKNAFVIGISAGALNFIDNGGPEPGGLGDSSSGFSGTLDLNDRRQWRHDIIRAVWAFFETIPFYRMSPRQDLVTAGYCLAEPGAQVLVYLPSGGSVQVTLDDSPYHITWINAQNTAEQHQAGSTTGSASLTAPAHGDDWLLYLQKSQETHP